MADWIKTRLDHLIELQTAANQSSAPTPKEAMIQRAQIPFRYRKEDEALVIPTTGGPVRGRAIFTTDALDTWGYSVQNAFVQVRVIGDSVPAEGAIRQLFVGVLEGSCGSPFVDLDQAIIMSTGGPSTYKFPLLSNESLSTSIRFTLYAADNRIDPEEARVISFQVQGMLVAGLGYS